MLKKFTVNSKVGMSVLNFFTRFYRRVNVNRDISYGEQPRMLYDEFPAQKKSAPIVIFWHGGSWQNGDKKTYGFVGSFFQKNGINGIVANYPKFPEQNFPGFIKDAQDLIEVIRKRYPKSKIYLSGHSSGAHTALITAMKQRVEPVDGVIALAPPNWFSKTNWPKYEKVFDVTYESKKQETYSYVGASPRATRYLLLHGANDITVSPKGTIKLHEYLMINGISSIYKILGAVNHFMILGVFMSGFFPATKREIKNFIDV